MSSSIDAAKNRRASSASRATAGVLINTARRRGPAVASPPLLETPDSEHLDELLQRPAVDQAVIWYRANREACPRPLVPTLRRMFSISSAEAVQVLKQASLP